MGALACGKSCLERVRRLLSLSLDISDGEWRLQVSKQRSFLILPREQDFLSI